MLVNQAKLCAILSTGTLLQQERDVFHSYFLRASNKRQVEKERGHDVQQERSTQNQCLLKFKQRCRKLWSMIYELCCTALKKQWTLKARTRRTCSSAFRPRHKRLLFPWKIPNADSTNDNTSQNMIKRLIFSGSCHTHPWFGNMGQNITCDLHQ